VLLGRREEPVHGCDLARQWVGREADPTQGSGTTKQEVRAKLEALQQELNAGVRSSSTYTVREAVDDWLREGLDGTSDRTRTLLKPVLDAIGARPLRVLSARYLHVFRRVATDKHSQQDEQTGHSEADEHERRG
jgi:hypothetical protein